VAVLRPERGVQVSRLDAAPINVEADEPSHFAEGGAELIVDDVGLGRIGMVRCEHRGQIQDEAAPVSLMGQVEELTDASFHSRLSLTGDCQVSRR
jgi:hypothetical protein